MARLIGWLLIGALVWWGLLKKRKPPLKRTYNDTALDKKIQPSIMVACAQCGIHLPQEDAISSNKGNNPLFYCSALHAQQNTRDNNHPI